METKSGEAAIQGGEVDRKMPNLQRAAVYDRMYAMYEPIFNALEPSFRALAQFQRDEDNAIFETET